MLWDQDKVANQDRIPAGTLAVSYPNAEVTIPAPGAEALAALATDTNERIAAADSEVLAETPRATLGEQCVFCSVRSLCDVYWSEAVPGPADVRNGTSFDYEGIVRAQSGARSWWMEDTRSRQ
jgi:hypothetical protein